MYHPPIPCLRKSVAQFNHNFKKGLKLCISFGIHFCVVAWQILLQCGWHKLSPGTCPTIFWSNSKFDQNLQCSGLKCYLLIITKFCTCHDSYTVVTCAKFCCDWLNIFQSTPNFDQISNSIEILLVRQVPAWKSINQLSAISCQTAAGGNPTFLSCCRDLWDKIQYSPKSAHCFVLFCYVMSHQLFVDPCDQFTQYPSFFSQESGKSDIRLPSIRGISKTQACKSWSL